MSPIFCGTQTQGFTRSGIVLSACELGINGIVFFLLRAVAHLKRLPVLEGFPLEAVPRSPYPNDSEV